VQVLDDEMRKERMDKYHRLRERHMCVGVAGVGALYLLLRVVASRHAVACRYIMELDTNTVIDARYKGNVSRFINHSCDPNCALFKW
jgi:hypothetical protein